MNLEEVVDARIIVSVEGKEHSNIYIQVVGDKLLVIIDNMITKELDKIVITIDQFMNMIKMMQVSIDCRYRIIGLLGDSMTINQLENNLLENNLLENHLCSL